MACASLSFEAVSFLLAHGALVHSLDQRQVSPLIYAIKAVSDSQNRLRINSSEAMLKVSIGTTDFVKPERTHSFLASVSAAKETSECSATDAFSDPSLLLAARLVRLLRLSGAHLPCGETERATIINEAAAHGDLRQLRLFQLAGASLEV
ncbi:unnamed protein product [Protopolystoma xenopodis]|uniref:Uncharacterized protein n=1 Tax=Protopolystoma xenopodis TaxID=117903 RepID=A0A3S4ZD14_9PLAT|nr:unnamed protein product [Protopolystoma xenopodis]